MSLDKFCRAAPLALAIVACAFSTNAFADDANVAKNNASATTDGPYLVKYHITGGTSSVLELTLAKRVSFADLDLQTSEGVKQLKRRLRTAAQEVCSKTSPKAPYSSAPVLNFDECFDAALNDAQAQLDRAIARSSFAKNAARTDGGG